MVKIKSQLNILSSLVAILAMAPVVPYLGPVTMGVAVGGVLLGGWCDRRERYLLNTLLATLLAFLGVFYQALQITRADVASPVARALVILLVLRLLMPKESRHYLQIFALSLFLLASASLVSLDLGLGFGFLTYLTLMVFAVTLGLVLLTVFVTDKRLALPRRDMGKLVKVGLILPVVSLLLMVVFFFVLPRTRHPLWQFVNPTAQARVGLAESVQPGAYASITATRNLAFRAEVEELAPEDLYWRTLVLNRPEGNRWIRVDPPEERVRVVAGKRTIKLRLYPEARSDRYLITLDKPLMVSGVRHRALDDLVYLARSALDHPYRLEETIALGAELQASADVQRDFYLVLPDQVSPRLRQVAAQIHSQAATSAGRLQGLADFFRGQGLSYAESDLPGGADPLDAFLFDKKRGYCEFFASAYLVLARLAELPARLVGGYYGGEYNPLGGYYLVTEDRAHVWVEVLTDDRRWIRIDPSQWAVNAGEALNSRQRATLSAWQRLMDSLNYRWTQTVLLFDFTRQMELVRDTRERLRAWNWPRFDRRHGVGLAAVALVVAVAVGVGCARRRSPEARLVLQLQRRLRKRYGADAVTPASSLLELGERLDNDPCREFARIYQRAVFRDRPLRAEERAALRDLLRKI